ncbi:MAG: PQQ-binding-like beta-propeller repeat protein [Planctomycetota bacterium]
MRYHTDKEGRKKPILEDSSGSDSGLDYYAQGGVVLNGIAYFTGDHGCSKHWKGDNFPYVVAFDVRTFKKIRTYPFKDTYDSTPLVIQRRDGAWLVLAHEHEMKRTVAMNRDTAKVEWISADNQPGAYFFGYSYYMLPDRSKLILTASQNGLHAMSGETGQDVWWVKSDATGGVTPAVDQENGWVFYQHNGKMMKLRATDGTVLKEIAVAKPFRCISWNTILVNDEHGYYIATYWIDDAKGTWCMALRVYDADLNLVWERNPVAGGKKSTITYAHGKLVMGSGNDRHHYEGKDWKHVSAFNIKTGEIVWKCDLTNQDYTAILNVPYANGFFYAETMGRSSKVFRIDASSGALAETIDYGAHIGSCAQCIIARGMILSGDLTRDGIVATVISENSAADWPGPFCDPQTNTYAAPDEPAAKNVPMREVYVGVWK